MSWIFESVRKPVVIVEDHVNHIEEILSALAASQSTLLSQVNVVCLDRSGPDTDRVVVAWLQRFPELQIVARIDDSTSLAPLGPTERLRLLPLDAAAFSDRVYFCRFVASLLRPRGLLLQDIQLETLTHISPARWWESIYLASTIRGMFPDAAPACRFMSNKSGFSIGFGKEMMEAGFDPRDVIDKNELAAMAPAVISRYVVQRFPFLLEVARAENEPIQHLACREDMKEIETALDLFLWEDGAEMRLGGNLITASGSGRAVKPRGQEARSWQRLFSDRFHLGAGLAVTELGARLAPEGALRAECTNAAARHMHHLRGRLKDADAILTREGHYQLARHLCLARVSQVSDLPPETFQKAVAK